MTKKKKGKIDKNENTPAPMPSLIFHEASMEDLTESGTPNADLLEKELQSKGRPPSFDHLKNYNHSARKMVWYAVFSLTLVIVAMWSWSIYYQFSSIRWNSGSDAGLITIAQDSWKNAFYDKSGKPMTQEERINELKSNLNKLLSGAVASSSPTTSQSATASPAH